MMDIVLCFFGGCLVLVVLDNCEYLLDVMVVLVLVLVKVCWGVRLLVICCELFWVEGEVSYWVLLLLLSDEVVEMFCYWV